MKNYLDQWWLDYQCIYAFLGLSELTMAVCNMITSCENNILKFTCLIELSVVTHHHLVLPQCVFPDSMVHGAFIWGRQDPGGPHVGHMNFAMWVMIKSSLIQVTIWQEICDTSLSETKDKSLQILCRKLQIHNIIKKRQCIILDVKQKKSWIFFIYNQILIYHPNGTLLMFYHKE